MNSSSSPIREVVPSFGNDTEDNTVVNLRQVIFSLRHQLSNLKTDNALLQQTNKSITGEYESLLQEKNVRIQKLEDDFQFLYKERESMKSLSSNTQQVNDTKHQQLKKQNEELVEENTKLKAQLDEVDDSVYKLNLKFQKAKSDLNYTVEVNEQLEDRLANLEDDNNQLLKYNDELIKKLEDFSKNSNSNDMLQFNEKLHSKNISLQRTNNQLQIKLDKLLQNKTSNELLKQKNDALSAKLNKLADVQEKCSKLEIDNIELQNKYTLFLKFFGGSEEKVTDLSMTKFIDSYNRLKNVNLILEEKYGQCKNELNEYKSNFLEIEYQLNNQLQPTIDNLKADSQVKDDIIEKLQSQIKLSTKEVEFLRGLLSKLEKLHQQNQKEAVQKSTEEYLTNLEKLVDDYKKQIALLQNQISSPLKKHANFESGDKRQRIDEVYRRRSEMENNTIQNENTQLQIKIKELENELAILNSKIERFTSIETKKKELHTLQMKSNPFIKDQVVKKAFLDALQNENNQLIEKYIKGNDTELVPMAVFERQELDKATLQAKLDDLLKRNIRFKQSFSKKARDILLNISKFFGFTIEFIEGAINPNEVGSKIKLTSKYAESADLKNSYLVLDLPTKSLKAYGNNEFKDFCAELMQEWSNDKDQVSCVLSALNIKLYQKYVLKI